MCTWGTHCTLSRHTDSRGRPITVDECIAPLVLALNDAGVPTVASCCGHGRMPGNIILADGRECVIMPNWKTARAVEKLMVTHHLVRPISAAGDVEDAATEGAESTENGG